MEDESAVIHAPLVIPIATLADNLEAIGGQIAVEDEAALTGVGVIFGARDDGHGEVGDSESLRSVGPLAIANACANEIPHLRIGILEGDVIWRGVELHDVGANGQALLLRLGVWRGLHADVDFLLCKHLVFALPAAEGGDGAADVFGRHIIGALVGDV